jgi:ring-1,2-phenylacetyl-CoA epoxidase subunit PaaD
MQNETTHINRVYQEKQLWALLSTIPDPEIPVLTITDLGIVRQVKWENESKKWIIAITPTYTACPAMDMIAMQIKMALLENGFKIFDIKTVLTPVWTTDWLTAEGKAKLLQYGIAPPVGKNKDEMLIATLKPACPQCGSTQTQLLSEFGSTACKALFVCNHCKEPFDYFKCH